MHVSVQGVNTYCCLCRNLIIKSSTSLSALTTLCVTVRVICCMSCYESGRSHNRVQLLEQISTIKGANATCAHSSEVQVASAETDNVSGGEMAKQEQRPVGCVRRLPASWRQRTCAHARPCMPATTTRAHTHMRAVVPLQRQCRACTCASRVWVMHKGGECGHMHVCAQACCYWCRTFFLCPATHTSHTPPLTPQMRLRHCTFD